MASKTKLAPTGPYELGSVAHFLVCLVSHLTQYDQKENARHFNLHRLGHLLGAASKVRNDMEGLLARSDAAAMEKLRAAISTRFIVEEHRGKISAMPPIKKILKQIDAWEKDRTPPKITVQKPNA